MSAPKPAVPYEMQSDPQTNRSCGAACLSMVYRSYGKEVAQAEIWPAIGKENRFGSLASTTHLMTLDALNRGFSAVAFQTRQPILSLRKCCELGVRAIMNHRLNDDSSAGHFTVLVDIDDKHVLLHDPFFGPSRRLSHSELLALWQPRFPNSEISGHMLIGVTPQTPQLLVCELCRTPIPASVECPACKKTVALLPSLLACVNDACIARMWDFICCPFCDNMWTFGLPESPPTESVHAPRPSSSDAAATAPATQAAPTEDLLDLSKVFAELDKFCNHVLSLPAAANHPEIRKYMETLAVRKEQLKSARIEALGHLKTHQAQLVKMAAATKQKQEAHRKKMEELNRPAPPLDGNALGHALLKNLGLKPERRS